MRKEGGRANKKEKRRQTKRKAKPHRPKRRGGCIYLIMRSRNRRERAENPANWGRPSRGTNVGYTTSRARGPKTVVCALDRWPRWHTHAFTSAIRLLTKFQLPYKSRCSLSQRNLEDNADIYRKWNAFNTFCKFVYFSFMKSGGRLVGVFPEKSIR